MIIINTNIAFLLTIIAGSATILGIIPIFFQFKDKDRIVIISLGFASGVMLSASFFDLVPEAYHYLIGDYNQILTILFLLILYDRKTSKIK